MRSLSFSSGGSGPAFSPLHYAGQASDAAHRAHFLVSPRPSTPATKAPPPLALDRTTPFMSMPTGYRGRWAQIGDEEAIANVYYDAFDDSLPRIYCFPDSERHPAGQEWWAAEAHHWLVNEQQYYVRVVEEEKTGEIVAFAKWSYHPHGFKISEQPLHQGPPFPGTNVHIANHFFGQMDVHRERTHSNKPHLFLSLLGVSSAHQQKRLSSILLSWGISQADKYGVPIYLESTVMGYRVYRKKGFREAGAIVYEKTSQEADAEETRRFGDWHKMNLVIMIRQPNSDNSKDTFTSEDCEDAVKAAWKGTDPFNTNLVN
ncbi:hypothetical protein BROUX41_004515 [Berkeleyomyces rouxiae]|uniref:uncharacterized protein n=1 Tax=Berkeleyomyces rouxiae TaxID=2035830 RepID=UPI003B80B363